MTEPRCLNATPFVLTNALEMLSIPVVLLHGQDNIECVEQWITKNPVLFQANKEGRFVHHVDNHITAKSVIHHHYFNYWLSVMFTNISFWESLRVYGDTVLTIQTDTLICSNRTPNWNVNYIGGISHGRPKDKWDVNDTNTFHLNGGLSIRRLDWMVSCLMNYSGGKDAEDAVFNTCNLGDVKVGDAMEFASDSGHTMCFDWRGSRVCPWGVHKPWSLGVGRGPTIRELVAYCPDIEKLAELLGVKENITGKFCMGTLCV